MTASRNALWDSLSLEIKHAVAALAVAWQSRHARRNEAGLPASSPEVSDDEDNSTMETGFDDTVPAPAPHVHVIFTMEQAHARYNTAMAEVHPGPAPLSVFQHAKKGHRYNLFLMEQHWVEGKIYCECASKEAMSAMAVMNPNFVRENAGSSFIQLDF